MKTFDLKHKIGDFLLKEEGKISKASILKAGIVLGAIALSAKPAKAGLIATDTITYNGDCPGIDAKADPVTLNHIWPGTGYTNAAHSNNLNVKNVFGRLIMSHSNCVETHGQHASSYHDDGGGGGGGGGWC